jgi:mevalonate kinase
MSSYHDNVNIMDTKELLKKNVYDMQEQLVLSHKRIITLLSTVDELKKVMEDIDYYLKGIKIYTDDISNLLNRGKDI